MNDTHNTLLQHFDLEESSEVFQEEFLDTVAETIMSSIMQKAWVEFEGDKKDSFMELLEASYNDPENKEKSTAVLDFLDENILNLREFVQKELQELEDAYKINRDELQDAVL